jgi:hypothetical protein
MNHIFVEMKALSSKSGKSFMQIQRSSGISYLGDKSRVKAEDNILEEIEVPLLTLDEFVKEKKLSSIDLIKIDCEGAEMDVLKGAFQTITEIKPDLIIEIVPHQLQRFGATATEIFSFLCSLGYKVYDIEGNVIESNSIKDGKIDCTDYFFSVNSF